MKTKTFIDKIIDLYKLPDISYDTLRFLYGKSHKGTYEALYYHALKEVSENLKTSFAEEGSMINRLNIGRKKGAIYYYYADEKDYLLHESFKNRAYALMADKYKPYFKFINDNLSNKEASK